MTCAGERMAFGQAVGDSQPSRVELADMATKLDVREAYIDRPMMGLAGRRTYRRRRRDGETLGDRDAGAVVDGCLPLQTGLRLHDRVPGGSCLPGREGPAHLRRKGEIMRQIIGRDVVGKEQG